MKTTITAPIWPEPDVLLEAAIGRALISWSVLDREIDNAIELVLRIDHQLAHCVAVNLGTKARLDIFSAAVHSLWYCEDEEDPEGEQSASHAKYKALFKSWNDAENAFVKRAERLADDTGKLAGEFRNWMAHGQIYLLYHTENERQLMWGKLSARKGGVRGRFSKLGPEAFDSATCNIRELVDRWHRLRQEIAGKVELLNTIDRDCA